MKKILKNFFTGAGVMIGFLAVIAGSQWLYINHPVIGSIVVLSILCYVIGYIINL